MKITPTTGLRIGYILAIVIVAFVYCGCGADYGDEPEPKTVTKTVTVTKTETVTSPPVTVIQTQVQTNTQTSIQTQVQTSTQTAVTIDVTVAKSGGVDEYGRSILLINGLYCENQTAQLVGDCAVEGINSWYSGKSVTKNAQGWFEYWLSNGADTPEECHVTLYGCGNTPNTCNGGGTWADYGCAGSPAAPGTQKGGPFMYCGRYLGGDYTCNIAFIRGLKDGHWTGPEPRGILPSGP